MTAEPCCQDLENMPFPDFEICVWTRSEAQEACTKPAQSCAVRILTSRMRESEFTEIAIEHLLDVPPRQPQNGAHRAQVQEHLQYLMRYNKFQTVFVYENSEPCEMHQSPLSWGTVQNLLDQDYLERAEEGPPPSLFPIHETDNILKALRAIDFVDGEPPEQKILLQWIFKMQNKVPRAPCLRLYSWEQSSQRPRRSPRRSRSRSRSPV